MSDPIQNTTGSPVQNTTIDSAVDSTPSDSIEAVVQSSIEGLGSDEGDSDASVAPSGQADQSTQPQADEYDSMIEAEMGSGHSKKRDNRIPYTRTRKIIEKAKKEWAAAQEAAIKQHTDRISQFEQQLEAVAQVEAIIANDPERFIQMLPSINPAYRQYFGAAADPLAQAVNRDGTVDLERLTSQIEQRVSKQFEPLMREHQSRAFIEATLPKVRAQIAEAQKWPLFEENRGEIEKVLQNDQRASLEQAYQRVVLPKLAASRDAMREEVLAELKQRPHSTSAIPSLAQRQEQAEPQSIEDVVAKAAGLRG